MEPDLFNNCPPPPWYLVENRPLLCYSLAQCYLANSLDSHISVSANGHASHALWDVIWKSRVGYRWEAGQPTRHTLKNVQVNLPKNSDKFN